MQVHLSHNVPGVNFVREVQVMRTVVLGPGTANDTGEMNPPNKLIKQTACSVVSCAFIGDLTASRVSAYWPPQWRRCAIHEKRIAIYSDTCTHNLVPLDVFIS